MFRNQGKEGGVRVRVRIRSLDFGFGYYSNDSDIVEYLGSRFIVFFKCVIDHERIIGFCEAMV